MPDEVRLVGALLLGLALTAAAVPAVITIARRTAFYDIPQGYKGHSQPTPYLGGVAILGGFLVAALGTGSASGNHLVLIAIAIALCVVGTIDDRVNLNVWLRLALEVLAAIVLWSGGMGWEVFQSDALDLVVTVLFVVGLVNGFNLMDNLDGATATVGGVAAAGAGTLAAIEGDLLLGALAFGLAGACFGFLPANLASPSKVFMGDGGSMLIGVAVAATIMAVPVGGGGGSLVVLAALPIAGLPILDMALVIVSRRRRRVQILSGGRDHVTHRLLPRLGSPRGVALVLGVAQVVLCTASIAALQLERSEMLGASLGLLLVGIAAVAVLEQPLWAPQRQEH